MKLKSVIDLTEAEVSDYAVAFQNIKDLTLELVAPKCKGNYRVGRCEYYGVLLTKYKYLTPIELAMICDGGFNHFGGNSNINPDGSFGVTIYTD